ncbi:unnamed protein product [Vicia faba]|uniref:Uncharacterized protein n=1 Tax=Vicia faba TaxID=3906 RepID=A0AAV1A1R9_VICFA|nr:unnamed protein product [Vicia faba]
MRNNNTIKNNTRKREAISNDIASINSDCRSAKHYRSAHNLSPTLQTVDAILPLPASILLKPDLHPLNVGRATQPFVQHSPKIEPTPICTAFDVTTMTTASTPLLTSLFASFTQL